MTDFTPLPAFAGGILIGLAAILLLCLNGRIAGISGILFGAVTRTTSDKTWRWLFIVGLALGGLAMSLAAGDDASPRQGFPLHWLVTGGLLVGVGTRLGSGCTSGHGVCGISRLSVRSLAATAAFMATGVLTATVIRHALGAVA